MEGQRNIIIKSSVLFVIASILEMTLHEFGHFFAAILVHAKNNAIHHNYTSNDDAGLSLAADIFIKGAGPMVSLTIGITCHFLCSRLRRRDSLFLFNLYMSVFGYIGFFGYLMIAPLFTEGDTGYICHALGFPLWLTITIAVTAGVVLFVLINHLMRYFVEMGSQEIMERRTLRAIFIRSLILYPLFIGLVITTALNLPVPVFLSLVAPICSPFTIMWAYGNALNKKYSTIHANKNFDEFTNMNAWLFVFLIGIIIVNRLLVSGINAN
jgi:hypothetical protein